MVIDFLHLELQYEEMEFVMTGETARRDLQQHLPVVIHGAIWDEILLITCSPSFYREGFQTIAKSENSYSLHQKEDEKTNNYQSVETPSGVESVKSHKTSRRKCG